MEVHKVQEEGSKVVRSNRKNCLLRTGKFYTNALSPVIALPTISELISFVPS